MMKRCLLVIVCMVFAVTGRTVRPDGQKVRIYHTASNEKSLQSIKQGGLCSGVALWGNYQLLKKSYPELTYLSYLKSWMAFSSYCFYQKVTKNGFPDQWDVIYFKPQEPDVEKVANFALEVDPNTTYVYNLHYRGGIGYDDSSDLRQRDVLYRKSRVLLRDYLQYLEQARLMVENRPDLEVQLDPETARPFYLDHNDPRKEQVKVNGQWVDDGIGCSKYSGEVIIDRSHIAASELVSVQDKPGKWWTISPVKNIVT